MIFDLIILDILENMSLIKNSKRIKQSMDFTGVQNRAIHPSDIDGVLEFDDKYLFLIEMKFIATDIPTGQKMMLERIINAWEESGRIGAILKVEHKFRDEEIDVPLHQCFVTKVYSNKKWLKIKPQPFLKYLNRIGKKHKINKCVF